MDVWRIQHTSNRRGSALRLATGQEEVADAYHLVELACERRMSRNTGGGDILHHTIFTLGTPPLSNSAPALIRPQS